MSKKWLWLLIILVLSSYSCARQTAEPTALEQRREEVIQTLWWQLDKGYPIGEGLDFVGEGQGTALLCPEVRVDPERGIQVGRGKKTKRLRSRGEVYVWLVMQGSDISREEGERIAILYCSLAVKLLMQLGLNPREHQINVSVRVRRHYRSITGQAHWERVGGCDYLHTSDMMRRIY